MIKGVFDVLHQEIKGTEPKTCLNSQNYEE